MKKASKVIPDNVQNLIDDGWDEETAFILAEVITRKPHVPGGHKDFFSDIEVEQIIYKITKENITISKKDRFKLTVSVIAICVEVYWCGIERMRDAMNDAL